MLGVTAKVLGMVRVPEKDVIKLPSAMWPLNALKYLQLLRMEKDLIPLQARYFCCDPKHAKNFCLDPQLRYERL